MIRIEVTPREFEQILEALRYWQRDMDDPSFVSKLSAAEIDELCERINAGDPRCDSCGSAALRKNEDDTYNCLDCGERSISKN